MAKTLTHYAFGYYSFDMDNVGIIELSHGGSFEKKISNTFVVSIGLKKQHEILENKFAIKAGMH